MAVTEGCALLVTLAVACTLLPFSLSFVALRHMSAFSAQLAVNLEPVYTIVLAIVLLGEQRELTLQFYFGVAIILAAVSAAARRPAARGRGVHERKLTPVGRGVYWHGALGLETRALAVGVTSAAVKSSTQPERNSLAIVGKLIGRGVVVEPLVLDAQHPTTADLAARR